ncbi:4a-hydroxytetrahydrobiopterin dehydratase [Gordonia sp. HY285]|uniref:Putative pterin-4-alpha-carbinolamine dehydratase n=1 Tax=Gordonia liuliyuniae TaxID=2911517 RepID=A0ABS9IS12_9ACTN|nr:4a-hydroxytetrahydrobiopterin dehydratase [Gordonia liuliyuniae]MCF8588350.1 4a-hydroxytetrahydrobiopterin dehydratase [Gordonia liuliyuniae]MCF8611048.1 4a-hydroxytetrahydrobiopterin dehydratase [Gordonia liuliyuniae]
MDTSGSATDQRWRETSDGLVATFATGSMVRGLDFVTRVVAAAEAANHHPDIDFRYPKVGLTLITHDAEDTVTDKDRALAREISAIAGEMTID